MALETANTTRLCCDISVILAPPCSDFIHTGWPKTTPVVLLTCLKRPIFGTRRCFVPNTFVLYRPVIDIVQSGARKHANRFRHSRSCGQSNLVAWFLSALCLLKDCLHFYLFCLICRPNRMQWIGYIYHVTNKTRRPASADRTARAANFRRDLEAT